MAGIFFFFLAIFPYFLDIPTFQKNGITYLHLQLSASSSQSMCLSQNQFLSDMIPLFQDLHYSTNRQRCLKMLKNLKQMMDADDIPCGSATILPLMQLDPKIGCSSSTSLINKNGKEKDCMLSLPSLLLNITWGQNKHIMATTGTNIS